MNTRDLPERAALDHIMTRLVCAAMSVGRRGSKPNVDLCSRLRSETMAAAEAWVKAAAKGEDDEH